MNYKFKCTTEDVYELVLSEIVAAKKFNRIWNFIKRQVRKKSGVELNDDIKDTSEEIKLSSISMPDHFKNNYSLMWKKHVKKKLKDISERKNFVFFNYEFKDIIYKKLDSKEWEIIHIFSGTYAVKEN